MISIGTTFNKRIFEARGRNQKTNSFIDMQQKYPNYKFYAYHENSFEQDKYNESIDFSQYDLERDNLFLFDLFEENSDWLVEFLQTSPLKDCHLIKDQGWRGHKDNLYWNRNAIYWFRKIAAIKHCIEQIDTKYLLWLDTDTEIAKNFDDKFYNYIDQFDCSVFIRSGMPIDSDIVIFNFHKNGKKVAQEWINYFLSLKAFKERRWDDSWILTKVVENFRNIYSFGGLQTNKFNISNYILHYKGTNQHLRKKKEGI